jgi:3-phosphoshikimate 1-carboxyvinyltransferase
VISRSTVPDAPVVEIVPTGPVGGHVRAPASKSVTNRLLVVAALAAGTSTLCHPLDSGDSLAMRGCVQALGADVDVTGDTWRIAGTGGALSAPARPLEAGLSGTTARFVVAACALGSHGGTVTGAAPLRRRPIGPVVDALRALGGKAEDTAGGLPVEVGGGGLDGGTVTIDVSGSSQFASAVLLVAPYARGDVVCTLRGRSAADYIALTVELMRRWGAHVEEAEQGWLVRAGAHYVARHEDVEYDASAAAHLFGLAAASGGAVTVTNASATRQPDAGAVDVLALFGCDVRTGPGGVTVAAPDALQPVDVSLAAMPDQVTTFAVLGALTPGTTVLRDVGVARLHETDRLDALATELGRLGVRVDVSADALAIHGGTARGPAVLRTYDDHRLAMAFAALGSRVPGVAIADPGCVAKTYPAFWDDARLLGCTVLRRDAEADR